MRNRASLPLLLTLALCGAARAEEPASLTFARETVDEVRGSAHAAKMRVVWPEIQDVEPPSGAEVVLVRGYISYEIVRLVRRDDCVEGASVVAARSWFYNRDGESFAASRFDVDLARFDAAWNAMRRILAAHDERLEPVTPSFRLGGSSSFSSHASADWLRVRAGPRDGPIHRAARARRDYRDRVRVWEGLRDEAVFDLFSGLVPSRDAARRPAPVPAWKDFAVEEIRAARETVDADGLRRDDELLSTCLRLLGETGDLGAESEVDAFRSALREQDRVVWPMERLVEECELAATRLRVRLHWDSADVAGTLRALPGGTWAREDQAEWLRRAFRERDPQGWIAFLVEEASRPDARRQDAAAAAAGLVELPPALSVPILRSLLSRKDPYVRLAAALALHEIDSTDGDARTAVVDLALDRSVDCDQRADLTDRWCRSRALEAALAWGGLTPEALREHLLTPELEQPEFLIVAQARLEATGVRLTVSETLEPWRRVLEGAADHRTLTAVRFLHAAHDVASKERMLAALDRLDRALAADGPDAVGVDRDAVARWREHVRGLGAPAGSDH